MHHPDLLDTASSAKPRSQHPPPCKSVPPYQPVTRTVRTYEFTIILDNPSVFDGEALLDYADRLFEPFEGDVNPALTSGTSVVDCTLEASSLEAAIRQVVEVLKREGLAIRRIEMEPGGVLAA